MGELITKVVIDRDTIGEWRLSAKAANGEHILGSEGYDNFTWALDVARRSFPGVPLYDSQGNQLPGYELPGDPLGILRNASQVPNEALVGAVRELETLVTAVGTLLAGTTSTSSGSALELLHDAYEPFKPRRE